MATLLVLLGAGTALATDPSRSTAAPPLTPRQRTILEAHIAKPWPTVKHGPTSDGWGQMNLAFARLALDPDNATVAASVNEEIVQWSIQFLPWDNYTVNAPLGGLGPLPILCRLALLPWTRAALSAPALAALDKIFVAWLSPRSKVAWAAAPNSWLYVDGSENLDATRKASLYLAALALNLTQPDLKLSVDGETVAAHAAAWEAHWRGYLIHRAIEGLGVEMGSPTYTKYAVQNYLNIADLSPGLGALAGDFLQLWWADVAQAFLPGFGLRGGAHNRVYRGDEFFIAQDGVRAFTWLFEWWDSENPKVVELAVSLPQATLFATSSWRPLPLITAVAKGTYTPSKSASAAPPYLYTSRRLGNTEPCTQHLGPVDPAGTVYGNHTCSKLPCKPCIVCGPGILAFEGSGCDTLSLPATVLKQEYMGAGRRYTLGAITLDQSPGLQYGADVGQNHQVGAFFGGANTPETRLVFGDAGSTNCTSAGFQRHAFGSITSRLVPDAMAVARPTTAAINPCPPGDQSCKNTDFPLFAFVSAGLYGTRVVSGDWECFNAANETFACLGVTGTQLPRAAAQCVNEFPGSPTYYNGTLVLFNGSASSRGIGVLQLGSAERDISFAAFLSKMEGKKLADSVDPHGNLQYRTLQGDLLEFGVGGVVPAQPAPARTYQSPFITGVHAATMEATLSAPGFSNVTLVFGPARS